MLLVAKNGHSSTVDLLLEKGADLKTKNNQGWNIIHAIAWFGRDSVLQLLLTKQVEWDLEARSSDGSTALLLAAKNGHSLTVDLLLGKGADMTVATANGWTPLLSASDSGYVDVVK